MTEPLLYKATTRTALDILDQAITYARSLLTEDIDFAHMVACRHSPDASAAWDRVLWHQSTQVDADENMTKVISDLVMLCRAASCLKSILQQPRPVPTAEDLKLPRQRRTA